MSDHADDDYSALPGVHVTVNQVVAYNLARWRKAAGLTQEELGEPLGWGKATVSAAERSWDGKRVRQFTASDIVGIARALGLPAIALLLPPEDDGVTARYLYHPPGEDCHPMSALFAVLAPGAEDDGPLGALWRDRYAQAASRYLDPERGEELASYLGDLTTAEQMAGRLERLRWQRGALAAATDDCDRLIEAIGDRMHGKAQG